MNVFVCLLTLFRTIMCVECPVRWFNLFPLHSRFPFIRSLSSSLSFVSVRVVDGKLFHPDGAWNLETIYVTVYSKRRF